MPEIGIHESDGRLQQQYSVKHLPRTHG